MSILGTLCMLVGGWVFYYLGKVAGKEEGKNEERSKVYVSTKCKCGRK